MCLGMTKKSFVCPAQVCHLQKLMVKNKRSENGSNKCTLIGHSIVELVWFEYFEHWFIFSPSIVTDIQVRIVAQKLLKTDKKYRNCLTGRRDCSFWLFWAWLHTGPSCRVTRKHQNCYPQAKWPYKQTKTVALIVFRIKSYFNKRWTRTSVEWVDCLAECRNKFAHVAI